MSVRILGVGGVLTLTDRRLDSRPSEESGVDPPAFCLEDGQHDEQWRRGILFFPLLGVVKLRSLLSSATSAWTGCCRTWSVTLWLRCIAISPLSLICVE